MGNRLQQTIDGVVTTYTYNDNDHLLSETENSVVTSYLYDDNGNTLEKVVDGLIDTEYSYSKDNRMLSANTGTSTISYTYDAGGIRQSQTVDGLTTHFLVDPNRSYHQVLEEQDDLFIPQVIYTYGDDLISQTNEQGTHTFGYDGLGSTRILTDSTGTVQNSYGYQAYGEISHQSGSVDNKYLFTGEQYDESLFQYYLRARYYNHEIGRFTQMDTWKGKICSPITLNKYVYVNANP
ncbi:MAG: RHS repeat-associated core domain-containing protein, partial [Proteobacteria bacterium]